MKTWLTKGTLVPEVFLEIVLRERESEPRSGCDGVKFPMFRVFILSGSFVYVEMKNKLKHKDCVQSILVYFV